MKSIKEIKEAHQLFIDNIPSYLSKLKEILQIYPLTYELDELDCVQHFYESNYKNPEKSGLTKFELDAIFEAYFGTAFQWHFGGKWELETSKSAEAYGLSCIVEYGGKGNVWVAIPIWNWHYIIETNQLDEPIKNIFERKINYFKISTEFILEPVRNFN
jgi:hypothetical protein